MQISINRKKLQIIFVLSSLLFSLFFLILKFDSSINLILIEGFFVIYFLRRNNERSLVFFVICTVLQNLILILCAPELTKTETQLIIILKEFFVYINACVYLVRKKIFKIYIIDAFFYLFLLICFIHLLVNPKMIVASIASLRQFLIPFFCYYYGKSLNISRQSEKKIADMFILISIIVCAIGIIFYFLILKSSGWP